MSSEFQPNDLFVSPSGNDSWQGSIPDPRGSNGPLKSITKARDVIRLRKSRGEFSLPTTVWLRSGEYAITSPLTFKPEDGGVTYAAYPGENPVVSAGARITGFESCTFNGVKAWKADVSSVIENRGYFLQLFVNGTRRTRARWPKKGFFQIDEIPENKDSTLKPGTFRCKSGDVKASWKNPEEIEIVTFCLWLEQRMVLESFDEATRVVRFKRKVRALKEGRNTGNARYYLENIAEEMTEPGEWYLDKKTKALYYIPCAGEKIDAAEVVASLGLRFVEVIGRPESAHWVENLSFKGLTFAYSDWRQPQIAHEGRIPAGIRSDAWGSMPITREYDIRIDPQQIDHTKELAGTSQSSMLLSGAIYLQGARNCALEDCTISHVGLHGIELGCGCKGNRIVGNTIHDTGGGGVKVNGDNGVETDPLTTGNNLITDNHIHDCGHIFPGASGVIIMHSYGNLIAHNHVHDMYYTGITAGATWGYRQNACLNNRIEKNVVYDIGKKTLSDCAGIYLLGVHGGTSVRHNVVHDVTKVDYGAFGINLDEGNKHVLVEGNLFYNIESQSLHVHFGEEIVIRNNVFVFAGEGLIALSRGSACRWVNKCAYGGGDISKTFIFERNIVVTDDQALFVGGLGDKTGNLDTKSIASDLNLFYDVKKKPLFVGDGVHGIGGHEMLTTEYTFDQWKGFGCDGHSVVADPQFVDLKNGDYALKQTSPAFSLGFEALQISDAGVRPAEKRTGWVRSPLTELDTEKFGYW